jgi:hypothetical protein
MLQVTPSDSANPRGDVLPQGKRAWGETFFGDREAGRLPRAECATKAEKFKGKRNSIIDNNF